MHKGFWRIYALLPSVLQTKLPPLSPNTVVFDDWSGF